MTTKMHPVEKTIADAFKLKRGAKESDKAWAKKLHEAATGEGDAAEEIWNGWDDTAEGKAAQDWVNAYTTAVDDDEELPGFDHADDAGEVEKSEEADAGDEEEAEEENEKSAKKAPAKGGKKADIKAPTKAKGSASKSEKPAKGKKQAAEAKPAPKTAEKPAKKASSAKKGSSEAGYKGHRKGSRKEQVHIVYDEKGPEAAVKLGAKLGVTDSTCKTWISEWKYMKKWG